MGEGVRVLEAWALLIAIALLGAFSVEGIWEFGECFFLLLFFLCLRMHNIFNQFFVFRLPTFAESLHFKITKSLYKIAMRDTKSGPFEEGSY